MSAQYLCKDPSNFMSQEIGFEHVTAETSCCMYFTPIGERFECCMSCDLLAQARTLDLDLRRLPQKVDAMCHCRHSNLLLTYILVSIGTIFL